MSARQARIRALIDAIRRFMEARRDTMPGVAMLLRRLAETDMPESGFLDVPPQGARHDAILTDAIAGIDALDLRDIAASLTAAKEDLHWREDDNRYYPPGADLGEGYRRCNLHTLLIGPDACGWHHPDFRLGVFMLGPHTLYRDHNHDAPELYLNLSERSGWRLGCGGWRDYPAASLIWNAAGEAHATRVYDRPFLSIFAWLENVNSPCAVIPRDDWDEIERGFADHHHGRVDNAIE